MHVDLQRDRARLRRDVLVASVRRQLGERERAPANVAQLGGMLARLRQPLARPEVVGHQVGKVGPRRERGEHQLGADRVRVHQRALALADQTRCLRSRFSRRAASCATMNTRTT